MVEKSKNHKENKKNGHKEKELLNLCGRRNTPGKTYVFTASVGPLISLHQHEEACERFCLSQVL